jgi:ankyrin repeat protein
MHVRQDPLPGIATRRGLAIIRDGIFSSSGGIFLVTERMIASGKGHLECVPHALLHAGADVAQAAPDGSAALTAAQTSHRLRGMMAGLR